MAYKSAFTLAEVLITLGIIGVVAAMTIPTLNTNIQEKQVITRLKAVQSIIAQALKLVETEYDTPENWGLSTANYSKADAEKIANIMKLGLKISLDCGTYDPDGRCIYNKNYKYLNETSYGRNYSTQTGFYKILLTNGSAIWFGANNGYQVDFFIDVNGKNPPNTIGRDLFAITYIMNKGLIADGGVGDDTPWQSNCKLSSSGWGCAYYILNYGNMNYLKKKNK